MNEIYLLRLYSRLKNFGDYLVSSVAINETYLVQYHSFVSEMERMTGHALTEFKVQAQHIKPVKVIEDPFSSEFRYSTERFVDQNVFVDKFQALQNYFDNRFA